MSISPPNQETPTKVLWPQLNLVWCSRKNNEPKYLASINQTLIGAPATPNEKNCLTPKTFAPVKDIYWLNIPFFKTIFEETTYTSENLTYELPTDISFYDEVVKFYIAWHNNQYPNIEMALRNLQQTHFFNLLLLVDFFMDSDKLAIIIQNSNSSPLNEETSVLEMKLLNKPLRVRIFDRFMKDCVNYCEEHKIKGSRFKLWAMLGIKPIIANFFWETHKKTFLRLALFYKDHPKAVASYEKSTFQEVVNYLKSFDDLNYLIFSPIIYNESKCLANLPLTLQEFTPEYHIWYNQKKDAEQKLRDLQSRKDLLQNIMAKGSQGIYLADLTKITKDLKNIEEEYKKHNKFMIEKKFIL